MASQRFCLRWNNHQSNLLSVFDQLLHAETFTDVTLAVEGQYLKAHKMVLSACSPYFQALFINHPEKHPIVILKDITYSDMKSLLDFMYRGEVSVDQERLTAFLRVAESLRIKGLTEVNDEKTQNTSSASAAPQPSPPPQLHRIQPYLMQQQRKVQGMLLSNPLLGSALTQPKRKRGRPRKLSGSSNGTGNDYDDYESRDNLVQGSPEMLEVKMGTEGYSEASDDNNRDLDNDDDSNQDAMDTTESIMNKTSNSLADAVTSKNPSPRKDHDNSVSDETINPSNFSNYMRYGLLIPKSEPNEGRPQLKIRVNPLTQTATTSNVANALQQLQHDSLNNNTPSRSVTSTPTSQAAGNNPGSLAHTLVSNYLSNNQLVTTAAPVPTTPTSARPPQRRRVRRKANSPSDDQAEHLTEMSVRGLDLFRYAKIYEGIYQCTECAKENIQKTFKNKYSFQRHAFLYHEGTQRKVFPCPVCSKEFSRPDKMKNHMKTTHECYMPKDVVYPLNFLVGSGGDAAQFQQNIKNRSVKIDNIVSQQQQKSNNSPQQQLQQQQKIAVTDAVSLQIQNIVNSQSKVENMIVTPQIQHILGRTSASDSIQVISPSSASSTSTTAITSAQQQQILQQQQQVLQQHIQQMNAAVAAAAAQAAASATTTNSDTLSTDNVVGKNSLAADDATTKSQNSQQQNESSQQQTTATDNTGLMSQFNTQMLSLQKIKIENTD